MAALRVLAFSLAFSLCRPAAALAQQPGEGWPAYGGNDGGQRYSAASQITPVNVGSLQPAWVFHTHALENPSPLKSRASFEATPVLWHDTLYLDSPFDQVFAIDAATGAQRWTFDPKVTQRAIYNVTSRGVSLWHAPHPSRGPCASDVVFVATLDRRLIALDAIHGTLCPRFGQGGTVDLGKGIEVRTPDMYEITSPPAVVNNVLVVGSQIGDNQSVFLASGAVRGFDAVTGRQLWSWEPLPWAMRERPHRAGSGNTWAPMSADPEHDLVFLPTGSASVDFYGGQRIGDDRDADSIVALQASTGKKVWSYQLVHHDLWDYDLASQPLLFTFHNTIPAVAVVTKNSMVFVFNRLTGEPLYPIYEKRVPASTLSGEQAWPTQPFSSLPSLTPLSFSADDVKLKNASDQDFCRNAIRALDNQGPFTPPSPRGALVYPGDLGGANWGSAAFSPSSGVPYVRVSSLPFSAREVSNSMSLKAKVLRRLPVWAGGEPPPARNEFRTPDSGGEERESSPQEGTPYNLVRRVIAAPDGTPCAPEPFGSLVAINLNSGQKLWSVAHGDMAPGERGSYGIGGPIVTAGGLVFVASSNDATLRAYDAASGKQVWQHALPAVAEATPMTYSVHGRQFVIIAAGGHGSIGKPLNDALVAFALPEASHLPRTNQRSQHHSPSR